jgi:5-methyltetrahydrofolate--homocysteine methyltransferase
MPDFEALKQAVIAGKRIDAVELTKQAIDEGVDPQELISRYLIPALNVVGDKFEKKEIFVPEMMIAARSMQACMDLVKPLLQKEVNIHQGTVVIGTVFGDLHDIGKNLVKLLLESSGLKVIDLGVGVKSKKFVDAAKQHSAGIVGLSSLLTTGDPYVLETVKVIKGSDISRNVKVICGGAALTRKFVEETCGADAYAKDAAEGVRKIKELLGIPAVPVPSRDS